MKCPVTLFSLAVVASAAVPSTLLGPVPAYAQVYPERIRLLTGTRTETSPVVHYQRGSDARQEQTERFTRTLKIGSDGALDIANTISGDIIVTRGGGNEVTIEVLKTARARTVEEARELLNVIQVDFAERGTRAEVKTRYEVRGQRRRNINVSLAYHIKAPERTRITARTISGDISVRDIRGDLALDSTSGDIKIVNAGRIPTVKSISGDVEIADTTIEGSMDASTTSGTLLLRNVKARRLELGSVSGDVVLQDIACDQVDVHSMSGQVHFNGALARGGRYELRSHSGEVRVTIAGNTGFEVEATSFSGSVRTDVPLKIEGSDRGQRRQRAMRGTYGDGSAVLELTTFSGSIVIAKR